MTRYLKTDALVLSSRTFNEADRLVTFLTWEKGKVDAVVRGARKTKSKLAAGIELFTYGHYVFYQGRSLMTLTQQDIKENHSYLNQDLEAYGFALYFTELVYRLVEKDEPLKPLCHLLLAAWRNLQDNRCLMQRKLLSRAFEIKFLSLLGYCPTLEECAVCGRSLHNHRFCADQEGVVCQTCSSGPSLPFSSGTAALARFLLQATFPKIKILRPFDIQQQELENALSSFLRYYSGVKEFRALQFLAQINPLPRDKKDEQGIN